MGNCNSIEIINGHDTLILKNVWNICCTEQTYQWNNLSTYEQQIAYKNFDNYGLHHKQRTHCHHIYFS